MSYAHEPDSTAFCIYLKEKLKMTESKIEKKNDGTQDKSRVITKYTIWLFGSPQKLKLKHKYGNVRIENEFNEFSTFGKMP